MKPPFETHNDALFTQLGTFIVGMKDQLEAAELDPFGVATRWLIDPTHSANATFFELLQRLDALTFGTVGMPMEKWIFYDCAELPGFIYGFALNSDALTPDEMSLLGVPRDYLGPVPVSMYIAIPMRERGAWFGHNLASLNRQLTGRKLSHLGTLTKAMALRAMRATTNVGVTQWSSMALHIHTKFGPLDLETTWTPVHSFPASLTYAFPVSEDTLRAALGDPTVQVSRPLATEWLDADDTDAMQSLQRLLEAGGRVTLAGPPIDASTAEGRSRKVPLVVVPA
jgi:hypothetical protein